MKFQTKKYIVKNNMTNRTFEVMHVGDISLDMVWQSVRNMFLLGSNVTITNENGESKTFSK